VKAKIILYIEGDKEAIDNVYFEITHNSAVTDRVTYWKKTGYRQYDDISAIVSRTKIEEIKSE